MIGLLRSAVYLLGLTLMLSACHSTPSTGETNGAEATVGQTPVSATVYQEFSNKFKPHDLPYSLPTDASANAPEIDKKHIKEMLSADFTKAFGKDDEVPGITENIDNANTKYFAEAKLKLDSFDAFIIHKQGEDNYYFLCLFDKQGKFTDGTWIAFTEGTNDDGTLREASINPDGSIIISQSDVTKGKPEAGSTERHFYEITVKGKIRDLKENATPGNA